MIDPPGLVLVQRRRWLSSVHLRGPATVDDDAARSIPFGKVWCTYDLAQMSGVARHRTGKWVDSTRRGFGWVKPLPPLGGEGDATPLMQRVDVCAQVT